MEFVFIILRCRRFANTVLVMKQIIQSISALFVIGVSGCTSSEVAEPDDPLPCDPLADPSDPNACAPSPGDPPAENIGDLSVDEPEATLSTDTGELTTTSGKVVKFPRFKPDNSEVYIIDAQNLLVPRGSTLTLSGVQPSVFRVSGTATIEGAIKVESGRAMTGCGDSAGKPGAAVKVATRAAGGGGGGGLAVAGGAGGTGYGGRAGGAGGKSRSGFVGGCPGGKGGDNTVADGSQGGRAGVGGGAILIVAHKIKVTGQIIANGTGGGAGTARGGGGGGGSGGMIYLDGYDVELGGAIPLCANGGGGGEAGLQGGHGNPGSDGRCSIAAAPGGRSPAAGGNGGNGGFRDDPGTKSINERAGRTGGNGIRTATGIEGGGGGGGGSTGRILIRARNNFVVQPASVTSPALERKQ